MEGGQGNGGCEVGQGRFEVGFQGTGQRVESVGSPHLRLKAFKTASCPSLFTLSYA